MTSPIDTPDQAFAALANPGDPNWGAAFALLASQPETAQLMLEAFAETLEQLGVVPSGIDPASGLPAYSLDDVTRALGVPMAELDPGAGTRPSGEPGGG